MHDTMNTYHPAIAMSFNNVFQYCCSDRVRSLFCSSHFFFVSSWSKTKALPQSNSPNFWAPAPPCLCNYMSSSHCFVLCMLASALIFAAGHVGLGDPSLEDFIIFGKGLVLPSDSNSLDVMWISREQALGNQPPSNIQLLQLVPLHLLYSAACSMLKAKILVVGPSEVSTFLSLVDLWYASSRSP